MLRADRVSSDHAIVSVQPPSPRSTSVTFTLRKMELEQKAKESEGRGKWGKERTRRNSLVEEFKWNDEKKLEGRTE